MDIRPTKDWYWYFDEKLDALMINLSHEMVFRSRLTKKMVITDAIGRAAFSLQDTALYYQFYESCHCLSLSKPSRVELVLNAIAAKNYIKPLMPKSWYFITQISFFMAKLGEVTSAYLQDGGAQVDFLVADIGASASLCIVAQSSIIVADKTFYLGEAMKIMNNRCFPYGCSPSNTTDSLSHDKKTSPRFLKQ